MHMRLLDCPDGCECPHCEQFCGALNDLERELEETQEYLDKTKDEREYTERELEYAREALDNKPDDRHIRNLEHDIEELRFARNILDKKLEDRDNAIAEAKRRLDELAEKHLKEFDGLILLAQSQDIAHDEKVAELLTVIRTLRKGPCDPVAPCDLVENGAEGTYVCSYHDYAD